MEAPEPFAEVLADLRVERTERLVQQQHPGFDGKGAREGDALPLPARKLGRVSVSQILHLYELKQTRYLRLCGVMGRRSESARRPKAILSKPSCAETRHSAEYKVTSTAGAVGAISSLFNRLALPGNRYPVRQ